MLKIALGLLVGVLVLMSWACGDGEDNHPTPIPVSQTQPAEQILKITGSDVQRTQHPGSWYFAITLKVSGSCQSYSSTWTMPDGKKVTFKGPAVSFEVTVPGKFDLPVTIEGCHQIDRDVVHLSTDPQQVY